ncbi:hypothetical protein GGR56DRAFT_481412 [Xylariaceae sp. FL0804]|nr:hypothetical protein GGR56DRAFT_481412 [Xylariaceae sp. FL0804]
MLLWDSWPKELYSDCYHLANMKVDKTTSASESGASEHHAAPPAPREEGWTRVHRKRRGRTTRAPGPESATSLLPTPSPPSLTLAQMQQDHERFTSKWKDSPSCRQLREMIASRAASSGSGSGVGISRAVCFGLGSFDPSKGYLDAPRQSHIQLAAFLCIVDQLSQSSLGGGKEPMECFFQEPVFNAVDKSFIESLGHQVVDSPEGFRLVDASTVAFGVHLYKEVYLQIIEKHIPAIFVGTPCGVWEDADMFVLPDWPRMRKLDQLCDKRSFPAPAGDFVTFSNTSVHWRRLPEDEKQSTADWDERQSSETVPFRFQCSPNSGVKLVARSRRHPSN